RAGQAQRRASRELQLQLQLLEPQRTQRTQRDPAQHKGCCWVFSFGRTVYRATETNHVQFSASSASSASSVVQTFGDLARDCFFSAQVYGTPELAHQTPPSVHADRTR